jgi:asparagine synthetase B (glutamine-hydrolysing)
MSGFAILVQPYSSAPDREDVFQSLLKQTAQFKRLSEPASVVDGRYCTAAKLDAPSSLHRGIARDDQSGSWVLAAGTVMALEGNNDPSQLLGNFLADYLENGPKTLDHYDGHFALAIYNGRDDSLSIVSDPMGLFAIYYARRGEQVFVSSSALAIARQICAKPDELTIECFLRTGRPYGENTLWQEVKRVRPATIIRVYDNKLQEYEYWTPFIDKNVSRLSMNEALELANEKIYRNFEQFLSRKEKVWADLTGGFDTRLTAMFMEKVGIPFIGYCEGPDSHPDVEISRLVSKEMGWEYSYEPLPIDWEEEQLSWISLALGKGDGHLNAAQLAYVLKGKQDRSLMHPVNVSGTGLDEWRYTIYGANLIFPGKNSKANFDDILNRKILFNIPLTTLRHDCTAEVRKELKDHFARLVSNYAAYNAVTQTDIIFGRHRHPTHGGAYLSSAAGILRAKMPFCLKELQSFGLSLNHYWRFKYHFGFGRTLLENGNPRLARICTDNGVPAMPIRITNIDKFVPLWKILINIVSARVSAKLFKRKLTIFPTHTSNVDYPLPAWRNAWINWALSEKLLEPSQMHSGALYNPVGLKTRIEQTLAGTVQPSEYLDWVITVEMAMRATGASFS